MPQLSNDQYRMVFGIGCLRRFIKLNGGRCHIAERKNCLFRKEVGNGTDDGHATKQVLTKTTNKLVFCVIAM